MWELTRRLAVAPWTTFLLLLASLLANALALATPLFVIQILNRFLAVGEISTLTALLAGAAIAVLFEFLLRGARFRLARAQSAVQDLNLYTGVGSLLGLATPKELKSLNAPGRSDTLDALSTIQSAFGPQNLCNCLDVPFSFVFVVIVYLIDPRLGMIAAGCIVLMMIGTVVVARSKQRQQSMLAGSAKRDADKLRRTMGRDRRARYFTMSEALVNQWRGLAVGNVDLAKIIASRASSQQSLAGFVQAIQTLALISFGALLTLDGQLDIGSLIGVNILAARALMPISRFAGTFEALQGARPALETINQLKRMPISAMGRNPLAGDVKSLVLRQVGVRPEGASLSYFSDLSVALSPGTLTLVHGDDPMAQSVLTDLLANIEQPTDGIVLINDVNLQSVPFEWWRLQVGLVPSEPLFRDGTLRENFQDLRGGGEEEMLAAIDAAGIRRVVESHPNGLDMPVTEGMDALPGEVRWRLGLARALYLDPPIFVVEDPNKALSVQAAKSLSALYRNWTENGKIVFCAGATQELARQADQVVTLRRGQSAVVQSSEKEKPAETPQTLFTGRKTQMPSAANVPGAQMPKVRNYAQALCAVISLFVVAAGYWAYEAELDRAVSAQGEVIPSKQVQTIESLEGGIVQKILIQEGELVQRDQPVLELQSVSDDADIGELDVRLAALQAAVLRLEAELDGEEEFWPPVPLVDAYPDIAERSMALFRARRLRLERDLAARDQVVRQREQEIIEIQTRADSARRRIKIVEEQVAISADLLSSDLTNRMEHLELVSVQASLEAELAQAGAARATAGASLAQAKAERALVISLAEEDAREELDGVTQELRELGNRMGKLADTRERRVLRSPIDGTIKALSTFTRGAVITPGEVVAEVVPNNDALLIEALLPISEVGFISSGMEAQIRLASRDAFRYQAIDGVVARISPDSFTNDSGDAFYKMIIETQAEAFSGNDGTYALVPGLKVGASILLGKRTVLQYLAQPILAGLGQAFQER